MTDFRVEVIISETIIRGQRIVNSLSTSEYHAVDFTYDNNVAKVGVYKGIHVVISDSLSQKWLISPEAASKKFSIPPSEGLRRSYIHPCCNSSRPITER